MHIGVQHMAQTNWLVVESVGEDGRRFRPSDWIERISTILAKFDADHRLVYSASVRPQIISGEKCLVIDRTLQQTNPDAYEYVINFVESNRLRTHEV